MSTNRKGIRATHENSVAAFKEAGHDVIKITVTELKTHGATGARIVFELPDGTHGVLNALGSILPAEPRVRRALINNLIASSRRITASPK